MFAKCKQLAAAFTSTIAESFADLLFEIGKEALTKRNYELAVRWLERAHDVIGEQDLDTLSPDVGELRLCTMQSIGAAIIAPTQYLLTERQFRRT